MYTIDIVYTVHSWERQVKGLCPQANVFALEAPVNSFSAFLRRLSLQGYKNCPLALPHSSVWEHHVSPEFALERLATTIMARPRQKTPTRHRDRRGNIPPRS